MFIIQILTGKNLKTKKYLTKENKISTLKSKAKLFTKYDEAKIQSEKWITTNGSKNQSMLIIPYFPA